jgi:adenylate cyclase
MPRAVRGLQGGEAGAPFVGRDRELSELVAAFERMLEGKTQVATLVGEAGAGKTRLLAEFHGRLEAQGHLKTTVIRRAVCSSVDERTYGVPAALLRDAYGVMPYDSPTAARNKFVAGVGAMGADQVEIERLAALLGYLLGFETEDPRTRQIDPEQLERQIFLAVQDVVERRLQHSALVLVVEDLHWADAASIELLKFLVDRLQNRRFMLVVSHRAAHDGRGLTVGQGDHTIVRLQPLSATDGEALLGALVGAAAAPLTEELRPRILEHAGGNPLFIEEMVRALAGGVLVQDQGRWVYRTDAAAVHVPLTIHGLLLARIDRLPASARQALQEAAVVGPAFSETLLREVASDPGSLDEALALLVDIELLADASQPTDTLRGSAAERRYRFRHGLFHETAYQNLLMSRRSELHTRIGRALEQRCGPEPQRLEDLETLGHHFRLSTDKPRGAHYLSAAGDWASAIHANADALRHYQRALEILEACEGLDAQRLTAHERLGDLLGPAGQRAEALRHFFAAHAGHTGAADRPAQARVLRKIGALHWDAGDRGEAVRCFQEGLALTEAEPDHMERAHLYQEMGQLAFRSGDNDGAVRWAERALAHAEGLAARLATGDERRAAAAAVSLALNTLGVALARLDRPEEAVAQLVRSVAIARDADLLQIECRAVANLGVLYSTLDPARAIETCERGLETAKRIGDLGLQSRLYTNLAVAYCALTNRCDEDGVGAAHTAIELDRRLGQLDHLAVPLVVLGQIYQCHGDPTRAMGYYQEAMVLAENVGEPQLLFPCYDGLATLFLDTGDEAQAERYMRKAQEVCQRAGLDPDALTVLPFLG